MLEAIGSELISNLAGLGAVIGIGGILWGIIGIAGWYEKKSRGKLSRFLEGWFE